jgi:hypothetical protein
MHKPGLEDEVILFAGYGVAPDFGKPQNNRWMVPCPQSSRLNFLKCVRFRMQSLRIVHLVLSQAKSGWAALLRCPEKAYQGLPA